mmetsp:Transcript_1729/g.4586  ORF Transcript_1729/g.4586 Transcript_1729/m.4586 type:complete len:368 (+) Transcript_1729:222-1325(+)
MERADRHDAELRQVAATLLFAAGLCSEAQYKVERGGDRCDALLRKGSTAFTSAQQDMLWTHFRANRYPDKSELCALASHFGKPLTQVRTWFNNRRAKESRRIQRELAAGSPSAVDTQESSAMSSQSGAILTPSDNSARLASSKSPQATVIKRSRLKIGAWEVRPDDAQAEHTLEIKFLYGRNKVRYELFLGAATLMAENRGGPYGCIDVPLEAIREYSFERGADCKLHLSVDPSKLEFLLQPEWNFAAYRSRTMQRMYQASPTDFTPDRCASTARTHIISVPGAQIAALEKKMQRCLPALNATFETSPKCASFQSLCSVRSALPSIEHATSACDEKTTASIKRRTGIRPRDVEVNANASFKRPRRQV